MMDWNVEMLKELTQEEEEQTQIREAQTQKIAIEVFIQKVILKDILLFYIFSK